jgi:glutamate/tyrosine decarboxylase-like PLP-dependent enzyme
MYYWKKLSQEERSKRIENALQNNVNFAKDLSLGYPASKLDGRVFYDDAPFLKDASTLRAYVANPNNIGCHTFGTSEKAFAGTQKIEREVLDVIAVDIFKAKPNEFDGYISPGGTEANIQAFWIFRNYFMNNFNAKLDEIVLIVSEDTHYSIAKASNLLMIDWIKIPVNFEDRTISKEVFKNQLLEAQKNGKNYFIVVANMGTTMFGAVDDIHLMTDVLQENNLEFKLHIDGAYGGFFYPFSNPESTMNFENPYVSSITIDAHKVLQAPYGTGIFICKKGLIENVLTKEAAYVEGMDLTVCGSRSGANAVAVWMILFTYGGNGWFEKISILQMRTNWFCNELTALKIQYFRNPYMNIVTLKAAYISEELAERFDLVPQKHDKTNQWFKVIMMEHVEIDHLTLLLNELKKEVTV